MALATTALSNDAEFSQVRELPALKIAATDLDAVLLQTNAFIDAANGSLDSGLDVVKLTIDGENIEIPHLSAASNVGFPDELFAFSYTYQQANKPISSVTINLGDSSRQVAVSGQSADKVGELSRLLEQHLCRYATSFGGLKFRRVVGVCLSMLFLTSLMISSANLWRHRNRSALGILICSAIGFLLLLLVPWNRFVPGFVLYQRYSPFFLIRHAPEIFLLCLLVALCGIPLSYFLLREKR